MSPHYYPIWDVFDRFGILQLHVNSRVLSNERYVHVIVMTGLVNKIIVKLSLKKKFEKESNKKYTVKRT